MKPSVAQRTARRLQQKRHHSQRKLERKAKRLHVQLVNPPDSREGLIRSAIAEGKLHVKLFTHFRHTYTNYDRLLLELDREGSRKVDGVAEILRERIFTLYFVYLKQLRSLDLLSYGSILELKRAYQKGCLEGADSLQEEQ